MATLHVRNVPDELYELLRERASTNDRSIAAEATQLLQERLTGSPSGPPAGVAPGRRRSGGGPFARFTSMAREAVAAAQEQARELGHDRIDTEHLLLGVLAGDRRAPLLRVLRELRVTLEQVQTKIPAGTGTRPTGQIPFAPTAKRALELALREALSRRDEAVTPTHLVLGILDTEDSRGAHRLLEAASVDATALRERILATLRPSVGVGVPPIGFRPRPSFRVLPLEGDADAWETQLNEAASLGYDLVEIVDRRAILRRV